jgi:anti-sigma B factor antagonist
VREEQGTVVVAFEGDVDLESSPAARKVLLEQVGMGRDVVVDLSRVGYMDSSGVASLVEAYQDSRRQGIRFALVAVSPRALRVLELARLDKVFTIHETLAEGLRGSS